MKNSETEGKEEGKLISSSGSDLRQISDPVLTVAVGAGSTVVGRVSPKLKTGERRTNPQFYVKSYIHHHSSHGNTRRHDDQDKRDKT